VTIRCVSEGPGRAEHTLDEQLPYRFSLPPR